MVVVTALTNYSVNTIKNYVESLDKTGFNGRKIVLYYNPDDSVKEYLTNNNWEVYSYKTPKYHINFQRFRDVSYLIKLLELEDDSICFTDIKDVYFKKSPSSINVDLYIGADTFQTIEEHKWNADSIKYGFPEYFTSIKDEYPLCAGVIIGHGALLSKFFKQVYELGLSSNYGDLVEWCAVDQAAVNVLAYTKFKSYLTYPNFEDRIVLNMANLTNTENTENFLIYHQYDRHKEFFNYLVN